MVLLVKPLTVWDKPWVVLLVWRVTASVPNLVWVLSSWQVGGLPTLVYPVSPEQMVALLSSSKEGLLKMLVPVPCRSMVMLPALSLRVKAVPPLMVRPASDMVMAFPVLLLSEMVAPEARVILPELST